MLVGAYWAVDPTDERSQLGRVFAAIAIASNKSGLAEHATQSTVALKRCIKWVAFIGEKDLGTFRNGNSSSHRDFTVCTEHGDSIRDTRVTDPTGR